MSNFDFKAALPKPVKWATGPNQYDNDGKQPRSMRLFVPCESAYAFAQYIINSAEDREKLRTGKIWDYDKKAEIEVDGFYINGRGRQGRDGEFGTINPGAAQGGGSGRTTSAPASGELPF